MTAAVATLPLSAIDAGSNDRRVFDAEGLAELARSIDEHGLAQPITVRAAGPGRYEVVAGERRLRAHHLLGRETIDAIVRDLDDRAASGVMLAENVARADLDPIDEGWAYQRRMDAFGLSMVEVARWAGVSWNRVESKVRLLRLAPEVQELVRVAHRTGKGLTEGLAWSMDGLDVNRQRLAVAALNEGLSAAAFRALCATLRAEQEAEPLFDPDTFLQVQDYVVAAKAGAKLSKPEQMRRLLLAMAAELGDHPLALQARELVAGR